MRGLWIDGRDDDGSESLMSLRTAVVDHSIDREEILDPNVCACCRPTTVLTDKGPMVFYRGRSKEEIRDILYVRQIDGAWSKPLAIHNDGWKISGCPVNGPDAFAKANHVAVAWYSAANGKPNVFAAS